MSSAIGQKAANALISLIKATATQPTQANPIQGEIARRLTVNMQNWESKDDIIKTLESLQPVLPVAPVGEVAAQFVRNTREVGPRAKSRSRGRRVMKSTDINISLWSRIPDRY